MRRTVLVLDLGSGNLRSVVKAVEAADHNVQAIVSNKVQAIEKAERIIMPGQGAFGACATALEPLKAALNQFVLQERKPLLGICVGMQLFADAGVEYGQHQGLGWIPGQVKGLDQKDKNLKIPHMGWNNLQFHNFHPIFEGLEENEHVYFAHSYHFIHEDHNSVLATCDYSGTVVAAIGKDNIVGLQFHPEKSQKAGLRILENFLNWLPLRPEEAI